MARLIKNSITQEISCNVITKFTSGEESVKHIAIGDIVEDLRYVKDKAIVKVSGKVTDIKYSIQKITKPDPKNPVDTFETDVRIESLIIDASEQYHSNVITVPAMEILEDEGVLDVDRMFVKAHARTLMKMEYSDGRIEDRDLEFGDILKEMKIMTRPGNPDITGDFKLASFVFVSQQGKANITGLYLVRLEGSITLTTAIFDNIIEFIETPQVEVNNPESLADISAALNISENGEAYATLGVDVTIPPREDGKITTTMINSGQTLHLDLGGHSITTKAYAFYVNGGTLDITGEGEIDAAMPDKAYPAVFVASDGTCNMESGLIDTTNIQLEEGQVNWMYGVVCSGNGIFNMTGGKIVTAGASGISITNGTASGEGAKFTIGGDAVLESLENAAIYLADNKSVDICDNAIVRGGIVARMGDITVRDNAQVQGHSNPEIVTNIGVLATQSGVDPLAGGISALTGVYRSELGNDCNIIIKDNAKVTSPLGSAVEVAFVNTVVDQTATATIEKSANQASKDGQVWKIYTHDELAALAQEGGKTLNPEVSSTDLTVTVDGEVVYPVVDDEPAEEPVETPEENGEEGGNENA